MTLRLVGRGRLELPTATCLWVFSLRKGGILANLDDRPTASNVVAVAYYFVLGAGDGNLRPGFWPSL